MTELVNSDFSSRDKVFPENKLAMMLFGSFHAHLTKIERALGGKIYARGNQVTISGSGDVIFLIERVLDSLYAKLKSGLPVGLEEVDAALRMVDISESEISVVSSRIKAKSGYILPRSNTQASYLNAIRGRELVFGQGPAGTGKTFLAVAVAVEKLLCGDVDRIILSRPAVEAGEKLGFLPGDMKEKVDPYLRPLYDSLYDLFDFEKIQRMIEIGDIEIAPLAFMRGRTLDNAFVILDEAQNTTPAQMKMFLTRMGMNAKFMVTGDPGQVDLPRKNNSGLKEAIKILSNKRGIKIIYLDDKDVIRHPIVKKVIDAYNKIEKDN